MSSEKQFITITLSEEQVDTILHGLYAAEHEGQVNREEVTELYWAFGRGDECPFT